LTPLLAALKESPEGRLEAQRLLDEAKQLTLQFCQPVAPELTGRAAKRVQ
jgi:hypothetical protein